MNHSLINGIFGIALLAVIAGACVSEQYQYVPAPSPGVQASDHREQEEGFYPVPPSSPQGSVRVRSLGIVNLRPRGESKRIPALSLRMDVANTGGSVPWKIDTQEQVVLFPLKGQVRPIFVNSDSSNLPEFEVKPGSLRIVDLYFPLPSDQRSAHEINGFDFKWLVHVGSEAVEQVTVFKRQPGHEAYAHVYPYEPYPFGYGPVWWEYQGLPVWGPPVWAPPLRIRR